MSLHLENLFIPFEYIVSLYIRYPQLIDITIAFLVFLGLAKVTIGRMFMRKGKAAIIVGVAATLTVCFVLLEGVLGFSLRSFGGVAAGILIFIVGLVLFGLLKSAGLRAGSMLSLGYAILFLAMMAVFPNGFDFIAKTAHFINGILGIIFLLSSGKLIYSLIMASQSPNGSSRRTSVDREILTVEKKIKVSNELNKLREEIFGLIGKFNSYLRAAITTLSAGRNPQDALIYLNNCMKIEVRIMRLFKKFRIIRAKLTSLVVHEDKLLRKRGGFVKALL